MRSASRQGRAVEAPEPKLELSTTSPQGRSRNSSTCPGRWNTTFRGWAAHNSRGGPGVNDFVRRAWRRRPASGRQRLTVPWGRSTGSSEYHVPPVSRTSVASTPLRSGRARLSRARGRSPGQGAQDFDWPGALRRHEGGGPTRAVGLDLDVEPRPAWAWPAAFSGERVGARARALAATRRTRRRARAGRRSRSPRVGRAPGSSLAPREAPASGSRSGAPGRRSGRAPGASGLRRGAWRRGQVGQRSRRFRRRDRRAPLPLRRRGG